MAEKNGINLDAERIAGEHAVQRSREWIAATNEKTLGRLRFWGLIIVVGFIVGTSAIALTGFHGLPSFLHVLVTLVGIYFITSAESLAMGLAVAVVVKGPDIKIGDLLKAPFSGTIDLPNIDKTAVLEGFVGFFKGLGFIFLFLGLAAGFSELYMLFGKVEHFWPVFMVYSGVIILGLTVWLLTKGTVWLKRVAFFVAFAQIATGTYAMYREPSETEQRTAETREMSDANLDKRNAKQVDALQKFVAAGGILSPSQQEWLDKKEAETARGPVKFVRDSYNSVTYRKDIIHTLTDLNDSTICGIMPGERTFRVSGGRVEVWAENALTGVRGTMSITEKLRFNGAALGQSTDVGKSACVLISIEGLSTAEKNALSIRGGSIPFIVE